MREAGTGSVASGSIGGIRFTGGFISTAMLPLLPGQLAHLRVTQITGQSLFREIVADTVAEVADPVAQQVASLRDSGDLEADLRDRPTLATVPRISGSGLPSLSAMMSFPSSLTSSAITAY